MVSDYEAATRHKYRLEANGPTVPGVTTVINILDKPGLKWAAAKITAEYTLNGYWPESPTRDELVRHCTGEFDREWREKAARGTRVHAVAEAWARGETVDVSLADSGFVDACEHFHETFKPQFALTECVVLNRNIGYGGRFDFIADLKGVGVVMGDWKTGGQRPLEAALQASAYLHGVLAEYDEDGGLRRFKALPEVVGARTVYLREDGTFEMSDPFAIISEEQAWEGFKACLALFKIHKQLTQQLKQGEK